MDVEAKTEVATNNIKRTSNHVMANFNDAEETDPLTEALFLIVPAAMIVVVSIH